MTLREHLLAALNEAGVIDAADGSVPYWRHDLPTCPPGWGPPDHLLDTLEMAVQGWVGDSVGLEEVNEVVRELESDSSTWLG